MSAKAVGISGMTKPDEGCCVVLLSTSMMNGVVWEGAAQQGMAVSRAVDTSFKWSQALAAPAPLQPVRPGQPQSAPVVVPLHPAQQFAVGATGLLAAATLPYKMGMIGYSFIKCDDETSCGNAYEILKSTVELAPPLYHGMVALDAWGAISVPAKTRSVFDNVFAGVTFGLAIDSIVRDIAVLATLNDQIAKAPADKEPNFGYVVTVALLDLAKSVSYAAMAALILISALFVAIPNAAILILSFTTSALFFELIGGFASTAMAPFAKLMD